MDEQDLVDESSHSEQISSMDSITEDPEIMEQTEFESYPAFRKYFNRQMVDIDYLVYPKKPKIWYFCFGLTFLVITGLRAAWQASYTQLSVFSYYIGDISLAAGDAIRKQLASIYFIWITGSAILAVNLYKTQREPSLQHWAKSIGQVFQHYSTTHHPIYPGLPYKLIKMFAIFNQINFYSGGSLALLCSLPTLYVYPPEYTIYAVSWLPFNVFTGLFCGAYVINFTSLYFLFVYIFAQQMDKMFASFTSIWTIASPSPPSSDSLSISGSIIKFQSCLLDILQQLNNSNRFWFFLNNIIFLVTFCVQSMLLYIIFFVKVPSFLLAALIGYAILNFSCGQSFHFIFGAYGQRKVKL